MISFGKWYIEKYPKLYIHFEGKGEFDPPSTTENYLLDNNIIYNRFYSWDELKHFIVENEHMHDIWML